MKFNGKIVRSYTGGKNRMAIFLNDRLKAMFRYGYADANHRMLANNWKGKWYVGFYCECKGRVVAIT